MGQAVQPWPSGNPVHYERRRPEVITLYQVVKEHLESLLAQVQAQTGASLPQFVKDEFDASGLLRKSLKHQLIFGNMRSFLTKQ
jgi:hypothetical protein